MFGEQSDNWLPENRARIEEALSRLSGRMEERCAVFDFDNTCVFRDIGQAFFRLQLRDLRFRLAPEALEALLPECAAEVDGRPWNTLRTALLDHYRVLRPLIRRGDGTEARKHPAAAPFMALFLRLVQAGRGLPELGPGFAIALSAKAQAGFTLAELRRQCAHTLDVVRAEPLSADAFTAELPAPLGTVRAEYATGLRPFPEMRDLMRLFQEHGLCCRIVSASGEWLVRTAAPLLGFPLAPEDIFGVRLRLGPDELVLPEDADDYPLPFRAGKCAIIDRCIRSRPWFVAGDAETDYEMLTRPEPVLRLLINRKSGGLLASLHQRPDVLVQGLDQCRGCFRPSRESI